MVAESQHSETFNYNKTLQKSVYPNRIKNAKLKITNNTNILKKKQQAILKYYFQKCFTSEQSTQNCE